MGKLVVLEMEGDFNQGFSVTLEIRDDGNHAAIKAREKGRLPPKPEILEQYHHWQSLYRSLEGLFRPLKARPGQVTNISKVEVMDACRRSAEVLEENLNQWLNCEPFRPIERKFRNHLQP